MKARLAAMANPVIDLKLELDKCFGLSNLLSIKASIFASRDAAFSPPKYSFNLDSEYKTL